MVKRNVITTIENNRVELPSELLEGLNIRKGDLVDITVHKLDADPEVLKGLKDLLPITL